jgi:lipopolysaccharide export system protein LptA
MKIIKYITLIISLNLIASAQEKITINYADSLIGKVINGEQVREAIGNVSLTHNNIKISCWRVVQYFDQNKAELYGNVRVIQDTLSIFASQGTYFGSDAKVVCPAGATLTDPKTTLKANYGVYFFNQDLANFKGNVKITDNSSYTITSDELDYYRNVQKSYCRGNVKITTDSAVIYSDKLIYEKLIGISTAEGNVKIESDSTIITSNKASYFEDQRKSVAEEKVKIVFINENAVIYGNYAENYENTNFAFVQGSSKLIHIDLKKDIPDTLYLQCHRIEAYRNYPEHYIGIDSVKTVRGDFYSVSDKAYYFKNKNQKGGVISLSGSPVVWKDNLQASGDSVYAVFKENIEDIFINRSAFALQKNSTYENRFDQISALHMHLNFTENKINFIQADTNAASIYFVYDKNFPNGANRSEGNIIKINFTDEQIVNVKVYGIPKGTYFPENLVNTDELRLLGFKVRFDKPSRFNPPY